MLWIRRISVLLLVLVLAVPILGPWAIYWIGLSNIEGRPVPTARVAATKDEERQLRAHLHIRPEERLGPYSPWDVALDAILSQPSTGGGSIAAWQIARRYNVNHLRRPGMMWWHISGAALSIWISRNWTEAQIRDEAWLFVSPKPASNYRLERRAE